ncbi:MAG: hypothetical protein WKF61_06135 [Luteimonas sp.]
MKVIANMEGVYIHEIHAEIAEYRLRHEGVSRELLAYIRGCGVLA